MQITISSNASLNDLTERWAMGIHADERFEAGVEQLEITASIFFDHTIIIPEIYRCLAASLVYDTSLIGDTARYLDVPSSNIEVLLRQIGPKELILINTIWATFCPDELKWRPGTANPRLI